MYINLIDNIKIIKKLVNISPPAARGLLRISVLLNQLKKRYGQEVKLTFLQKSALI